MQLLTQLYSINSKSGHEEAIKRFVRQQLSGLPLQIEEDGFGNLLITKGFSEKYPCIAAHLDEVHLPSTRHIQVTGGRIWALGDEHYPIGIGADDKNGIWIALQLLQRVDVLKVALFVREERVDDAGYRHGSEDCDLTFFNNAKYVLQCDRKGAHDWVTFNTKYQIRLCEDDFIPEWILEKYQYVPVNGGVTDVVHLRQRGLSIPCCNISCGYYNAHNDGEYCVISELENCLHFVEEIIENVQ